MSISCIPHARMTFSASHGCERTAPRNFVLGLAIASLIWASLAAGTILTVG